jgi:hypothetical protein
MKLLHIQAIGETVAGKELYEIRMGKIINGKELWHIHYGYLAADTYVVFATLAACRASLDG